MTTMKNKIFFFSLFCLLVIKIDGWYEIINLSIDFVIDIIENLISGQSGICLWLAVK
jgi:hypothetical protein